MIEWTMRFRHSKYARCQEIRHQSEGGTRSVCGLKMCALRVGGRILMGYCKVSIRNGPFGRIFTHRRQLSQLIAHIGAIPCPFLTQTVHSASSTVARNPALGAISHETR